MLDIIDVSRWQGEINWQKVKASGKVGGVMIRAVSTASGQLYVDPMFEKNYAGAKAVGLPVGVYYYTMAVTEGLAQKELNLLKTCLEGKTFELPIAVDVEDNRLKSLPATELTKLVKMELKEIEKWGLYAILYTYSSFADYNLNMWQLSEFDLWLADYRNKRPTRKHGMWQYSSKGNVAGVSGVVDMNHVYKDYPGIIAKAGLTCVKGA